eukprot:3450565-Amphidinium_carterae.2
MPFWRKSTEIHPPVAWGVSASAKAPSTHWASASMTSPGLGPRVVCETEKPNLPQRDLLELRKD